MGRTVVNALVGFFVGLAGGLVGLGGAELRLPYLIGVLRLSPHQAVRVNLAVSLCTVLAAIPARWIALPDAGLGTYLPATLAIAAGAVAAAYLGAGWLRRMSTAALARVIAGLLVVLGVGLLLEVAVGETAALLPETIIIQIAAGLCFGILIGAISSVLGVAGGEVIIPTLVCAYGVPIKTAGSLSMLISLPTVLAGLAWHVRSGLLRDRAVLARLILPMGIGSALGAFTGGLFLGAVPADALKVGLATLLLWSAWKVLNSGRATPAHIAA